jgi:futalosine hydrolase
VILVVAATARELELVEGAATLKCGVGPVEAAASTAAALAHMRPSALLHVGVAGARGIEPGTLVIGSESIYEDLRAAIPVKDRVKPDLELFATVRRALPEALVLPIGTSASVNGTEEVDVEAMEGFAVLRAAELARVPAVEIRSISNEIGEHDRALWRLEEAFAAIGAALPRLVSAVSR